MQPIGGALPRGVGADFVNAERVIAERGLTLGKPLSFSAIAPSTNDLAKEAAREGAPHGATFVTEEQSAGRGRQGRAWLATRGEALLVSVLLRVPCAPARLPTLSLACGLATRDAIARWTRDEPMVKWPNDVWIGGRKVAGILVEGVLQGDKVQSIVVGVGINVHTRAFPDVIAPIATSIALHSAAAADGARPVDRGELLADLLANLDRDVTLVAARGVGLVHGRLTRYDALRGLRVASEDGAEGEAAGFDLEGRLVVRRDDGTLLHWSSGEVQLRARPA